MTLADADRERIEGSVTNNDELRRLSVQVAEKIMGCKPHHRDDGTWWCFCGDTGWPGDPNNTHRSGPSKALADYASDGNAMIALWSKMDADGWNMQVLDHSVRLFRGDVSSPWFDFPNPQAFPEAVARAALAAVEPVRAKR